MTALQKALAEADKINNAKRAAIRSGKDTITYNFGGEAHTLYYHSGRWNDRPSAVAAYR